MYNRMDLSFFAYGPKQMTISDFTAGNATLACSLVDVTGHPNGNQSMRDMSIDRPVTCSTGEVSPEIGVAFAAKIQ